MLYTEFLIKISKISFDNKKIFLMAEYLPPYSKGGGGRFPHSGKTSLMNETRKGVPMRRIAQERRLRLALSFAVWAGEANPPYEETL
jgi:hypothetical protein